MMEAESIRDVDAYQDAAGRWHRRAQCRLATGPLTSQPVTIDRLGDSIRCVCSYELPADLTAHSVLAPRLELAQAALAEWSSSPLTADQVGMLTVERLELEALQGTVGDEYADMVSTLIDTARSVERTARESLTWQEPEPAFLARAIADLYASNRLPEPYRTAFEMASDWPSYQQAATLDIVRTWNRQLELAHYDSRPVTELLDELALRLDSHLDSYSAHVGSRLTARQQLLEAFTLWRAAIVQSAELASCDTVAQLVVFWDGPKTVLGTARRSLVPLVGRYGLATLPLGRAAMLVTPVVAEDLAIRAELLRPHEHRTTRSNNKGLWLGPADGFSNPLLAAEVALDMWSRLRPHVIERFDAQTVTTPAQALELARAATAPR